MTFKEELADLLERYEIEIHVETEDVYSSSTIVFSSGWESITIPSMGIITPEDIRNS